MAFSTGGKGPGAEINVTPLIDVLLVLLIIFMVIVPVKERGLNSQVPQPSKGQPQEAESAALVLEVLAGKGGESAAPVLKLNSRALTEPELAAELHGVLSTRADRSVFVRGDRELPFDAIAHAMGLAKRAGAEPVALMTAKP